MGFMDSLTPNTTANVGSGNFVAYTETADGQPAYIICDLSFKDALPAQDLSVCVKLRMEVRVNRNNPKLIDEAEASYLAEIRTILNSRMGGRYVGQGVVASEEMAFMVFYIPGRNAGICKRMLSETLMGSFRKTDFSIEEDPAGEAYFKFLYPDDLQIKQINNKNLLKTLKANGDDGSAPRPIYYHAEFPSRKAAESFVARVADRGFTYVSTEETEIPEGLVLPRQHVTIVKTMPFHPELLEAADNYLLKAMEPDQGEYKYLEADIVSPAPEEVLPEQPEEAPQPVYQSELEKAEESFAALEARFTQN